jgi:hypothetical protein
MQLEHIDLSTDGIFEYGQLYVALSRATSLDGVYLRRFSPHVVRAHPCVLEFYNRPTTTTAEGEEAAVTAVTTPTTDDDASAI